MENKKININELKPAEYNPRIMPEEEYNKLKNSLDTYGLVDPIIIDLKHDNTIIGGHQRYQVLIDENPEQELQLIKLGDIGLIIKDVELKINDTNDQKALNLALNKISGEWDYNKLDDLLIELNDNHYQIELTGFNTEDLTIDTSFDELIYTEQEENKINEDGTINSNNLEEAPYTPLKKVDTIIVKGDKYQLDNHILLCGDSSNMDDIKNLIGRDNIDLVLTDPPYGIDIVNTSKKN